MSGGRKTESFYGIKTREIVVQNADGTFPPVGTVLTIVDDKGHTSWSGVLSPSPQQFMLADVSATAVSIVDSYNCLAI
jgi:hypothetical protein